MSVDSLMPVLVVDDSSLITSILRNLLRQLGLEDVDSARDGSAALAKMRKKRYGLVISDWNMEPVTGYDFLLEIRNDSALKRTPSKRPSHCPRLARATNHRRATA
jgi:two-component system, chemotaxis family, chemotaxis protein CheY